jgi:hypothetical protein
MVEYGGSSEKGDWPRRSSTHYSIRRSSTRYSIEPHDIPTKDFSLLVFDTLRLSQVLSIGPDLQAGRGREGNKCAPLIDPGLRHDWSPPQLRQTQELELGSVVVLKTGPACPTPSLLDSQCPIKTMIHSWKQLGPSGGGPPALPTNPRLGGAFGIFTVERHHRL